MFEDILNQIPTLPPILIYLILFFLAFIENIFPPSPSDLGVVICGSLIAVGSTNFIFAIIFTTIGSITGFILMFYIGASVDKKVIHSGRFKYIPINTIEKVESWFRKYGYFIIVANRFMPGTRAVISFFAGMSNLDPKKTIMLCFVSALLWNSIMLYLGFIFGDNIDKVYEFLTTYSRIIIALTIIIVLILIVRIFFRKRKTAA